MHTFSLSDYPVHLGPLGVAWHAWAQGRNPAQILILTDDNTRAHCLPLFLQQTGLPPDTPVATVPPGEQHKTLATCERIWQALFEARLDRQALVVNLGGGVIGDMGGFCAATYKRGIDFVQVPTTLLAMTDAAIGGKLGIDFQGIKNAIGVFRNPAAVFVDPVFLQTLSARERRSGFAEVIKHALIGSPALWEKIKALPAEALTDPAALSPTDWLELLQDSIAVKVRVVTDDPLEKGLRALLNFGHTVGHAVESYFMNGPDPLTHGEAVAIGMICETAPDASGDLVSIILRHFGHRPIPETAFPELWALMLQDKKNASGAVRMAVPGNKPFDLQLLEPSLAEIEQGLRNYNAL